MKKCCRPGCARARGASSYCSEHDAERKRADYAAWKGVPTPPPRVRLPQGYFWAGVNSSEDTPIAHVYDWREPRLTSLCKKSKPVRWTELSESHAWPKCAHCANMLTKQFTLGPVIRNAT